MAMLVVASGQYEKSGKEAKRSIELDPDFAPGYMNLGSSLISLNRLDDAEKTVQQASGRMPEIPEFLILSYEIAFLKNDNAAMERILAAGQGRLGAEDWLTGEAAYAQAYLGHLRQARTLSTRAEDLAVQGGQRERAAQHEAGAAAREAFLGNAPEARRSALAALQLSTGRDVEYGAAFALALSGEAIQSQNFANDLEKRFPEDTLVKFSYLPTLRAFLALDHQNPAQAVELLQTAAPYDLGWPGSNSVGFVGALYPIYVRGEAYLAEKRGVEAAAEFQKILGLRGIVVSATAPEAVYYGEE